MFIVDGYSIKLLWSGVIFIDWYDALKMMIVFFMSYMALSGYTWMKFSN